MKIENFKITTILGISDDWNKFEELTPYNIEVLNDIGSCKIKGVSFERYLNSLNNDIQYKVASTECGDVWEHLMITRVIDYSLRGKGLC